MKEILSFIYFLLICATALAQSPADSIAPPDENQYWAKHHEKLARKLQLPDLKQVQKPFYFRFWNHGQAVDIWLEADSTVKGELTNYVFWARRSYHRSDTLYFKTSLPSQKAESVLDLILEGKIITIPTSEKIHHWMYGTDGAIYAFEISDKSTYSYKTYWSPSAQKNLPEAVVVQNFIGALSDTFQLRNQRKEFESSFTKSGYYTTEGLVKMYMANSGLQAGYEGNSKMPFGATINAYTNYIGKAKIAIAGKMNYKTNLSGSYDFSARLGKGIVSYSATTNFNNALYLDYRQRLLKFALEDGINRNYQAYFWNLFPSGIGVNAGADLLRYCHQHLVGGMIGVEKSFRKPAFSVYGVSSIFSTHIDYKLSASKFFFFRNSKFFNGITTELSYEKFRTYHDVSLGVLLSIN